MFFEDNTATVVAPAREAAESHAGVAVAAPSVPHAFAEAETAAAETADRGLGSYSASVCHALAQAVLAAAAAVFVVPSVTENTLIQNRNQAVTVKM
jgi:hypothetical protein